MDLGESVKQAKLEAKKAAENCDKPGDPATSIWCELDGRKVPDGLMDGKHGVIVDSDYKLRLNLLSGTDIQNHNKKRVMYETFCEVMADNGFDLGYDIQSYSR